MADDNTTASDLNYADTLWKAADALGGIKPVFPNGETAFSPMVVPGWSASAGNYLGSSKVTVSTPQRVVAVPKRESAPSQPLLPATAACRHTSFLIHPFYFPRLAIHGIKAQNCSLPRDYARRSSRSVR